MIAFPSINSNARSQNPSFSQTTRFPPYSLRAGVMPSLHKKPSKEFGVLFNLSVVLVSLSYFAVFSASSFVATATRDEVGKEWKEAEALLKWKTSLDNQSQSLLSSWVGGGHPCNWVVWVGIACNESGSLTHLNLSSLGLRGTLYNLTFSSFPNLLTINLSSNSLYGTIPDQIGNISKLTHLDLAFNHISGRITSSIGNLSKLSYLRLNVNKLSGRILSEILQLTSLQTLSCSHNFLSGSIPQEIGTMSSLVSLQLDNNNITGSIPTSIGNSSNLSILALEMNNLSGSVPQEIGKLQNLLQLNLQGNNPSGSPQVVGMMRSLRQLDLLENFFTGAILASIANLSNLEVLFLYEPVYRFHPCFHRIYGQLSSSSAFHQQIFGINSIHHWKFDQAP